MAESALGRADDAEIDVLVGGKQAGVTVVGLGHIGTVIGAPM
jgi:dTDP-alpha-D-glucose dehydrogenase